MKHCKRCGLPIAQFDDGSWFHVADSWKLIMADCHSDTLEV